MLTDCINSCQTIGDPPAPGQQERSAQVFTAHVRVLDSSGEGNLKTVFGGIKSNTVGYSTGAQDQLSQLSISTKTGRLVQVIFLS